MATPIIAVKDEFKPEAALDLLLEAFATTLRTRQDVPVALRSILDLSRQLIRADAYAVWRTYDQHKTWRAIASEGLDNQHPKELHTDGDRSLIREAMVIPDVMTHPLVANQRATYIREGFRSLLILPMVIGGDISGTITFYFRTEKRFSPRDLQYAGALANFAAGALNTAELYEKNLHEKQRLTFLGEASAELASSLEYEVTLERVARLAVPHIADWCTVHVLEGEELVRVTTAHCDPAMLDVAREFSTKYPEQLVPDRGMGLLLRDGKSQLAAEIPDELLVQAARDEEHLRMMRALGITSVIHVALKSRGRILGAIRLIATGRRFDEDDLQLAESLASRAAGAVDNARLYREVLATANQLKLSHTAAKIGSWSWDLTNQTIFWSEEFKLLHGIDPADSAGFARGQDLVHPDDREWVMKKLTETLASDAEELTIEHRSCSPDGRTLWMHQRARIERDAAGKAVRIYGIAMDVTDRRTTEEALRRTEKLAATGRLAATVAHETNNPLEAVTNLVFLARHTAGVPEEATGYLDTAEQELGRVAAIVKQTLGFYRESTRPERTDVGGLARAVLGLYDRRLQAKRMEVSARIEPEAYATIVAGEIKQVLANLIGNAVDASEDGGALRVAVRRVPDGAHPEIEILVGDSGHGIAQADARRLFEPFFTTRKDVGTGLGLWVSRGIVEKHGGRISFESATEGPERGTVFTVRLKADASG